MSTPYGEVYAITNKVTGKIYVGQTTQGVAKRWLDHQKSARSGVDFPICRAVAKYGPDAFLVSVLETADSQGELDAKEIRWIADKDSLVPHGYNLRGGGSGGVHSTETKEKIRRALTGHVIPPEARANMQAAAVSRVQGNPDAWATVTRTANKAVTGKPRSQAVREKIATSSRGKRMSPESLERMRAAKSSVSDETRAKMRAAKAHITDETRSRMREAARQREQRKRETVAGGQS